jgi:hypothetical protein
MRVRFTLLRSWQAPFGLTKAGLVRPLCTTAYTDTFISQGPSSCVEGRPEEGLEDRSQENPQISCPQQEYDSPCNYAEPMSTEIVIELAERLRGLPEVFAMRAPDLTNNKGRREPRLVDESEHNHP